MTLLRDSIADYYCNAIHLNLLDAVSNPAALGFKRGLNFERFVCEVHRLKEPKDFIAEHENVVLFNEFPGDVKTAIQNIENRLNEFRNIFSNRAKGHFLDKRLEILFSEKNEDAILKEVESIKLNTRIFIESINEIPADTLMFKATD